MKITTFSTAPISATAKTTSDQALPTPSPSYRSRSAWPKRRTTLTLQTGLVRPVFASLAHEKSITPVARQPYSHGGFMAMTRSFWQDATWLARFSRLMPETRARVDALIGERTLLQALPEMMALLENNPILAAYGTSRAGAFAPAIEWDIWVSPQDPSDLTGARVIHGNAVAEAVAYDVPGNAKALVEEGALGSDVHTGPTVAAWKALFEAALSEAGIVRAPGSMQPLFLDVKSTYSSAEDINQFVIALATAGFEVKGVGTFSYEQLDGLHAALPVRLYDSADDLVDAQRAGTVPHAATALFNGGFLLKPKAHDPTQWQIDPVALSRVAAAQRESNLTLAIYIQETRATWQALDCLTRCINANAHIFALGFAYSGVRGIADTTTAVGRGVKMLYAQALEGT